MSLFDDAFLRVKQLVADFQANESFYLSPQYQEQEARRDFREGNTAPDFALSP